MDLLKIAATSVISLVTLFALAKLMGNKQVSQLSMFDYIVGISIGSIAAELATDLENPEYSFLALVIYGVAAFLVSLVTSKSPCLRKIINGRPLILFDNGKLYRKNFKKARLDISDFLTHCRNQGYFDLKDIQTAVFEYNGAVSVLPAETARPLMPRDMNIAPQKERVIFNVILDGHINDDNLKHTGFNRVWLDKQLHELGFHSAREIYLATVNTVDGTFSAYPIKVGNDPSDPFE